MVAAAGADVAKRHAWLYCKKPGELAGFIKRIALSLRGAAWAHDLRNGAFRLGKCTRRFARRRAVSDIKCADAAGAWRESQERYGGKRSDDATDPHALCESTCCRALRKHLTVRYKLLKQ